MGAVALQLADFTLYVSEHGAAGILGGLNPLGHQAGCSIYCFGSDEQCWDPGLGQDLHRRPGTCTTNPAPGPAPSLSSCLLLHTPGEFCLENHPNGTLELFFLGEDAPDHGTVLCWEFLE